MAEVDTSFYKDAQSENPLDMAGKVIEYKNRLLGNQRQQIAVQTDQVGLDSAKVELGVKRFGIMNSAISGLMGDPDFGKTDLRKKIYDVVGRLVKDEVLTAPHAVEALKSIPDDPVQQANAIRNIYGQTLSAEQRGEAFIGSLQTQDVGSGKVFTQTPTFPGKPMVTRGAIENRLNPQTEGVQADPAQPNYGARSPIGQPGIPPVQQGAMPATPQAPARAMVPSTPKVMGDREAIASGAYEQPASTLAQRIDAAKPNPIISALPPGAATAMEGSAAAYNDASAAAGKFAQRVNPLRQAIPLLEKMKETEIGPTSDRWNDLKSTAVTLGAGKIIGGIDPEKIRDFNELKKYFLQYSSQAAATLGPKTNDGLATAVTSNPNVHMDKLSALELSKVALGVERMQQAGVREFNQAVESGKAQPGDFNKFMVKWGTEQDPRAFVYDLMDAKAQEKVRKLPAAERAKVTNGMKIAEKWGLLGDVHRE